MRHLWYRGRYLAVALAAAFFIGSLPTGELMAAQPETGVSSSAEPESTTADSGEWEKAVPVSKVEELMEAYKKADKEPVTLKLVQDLVINYPVEWQQTKYPVTILTGEQTNPKLVARQPFYMIQIIKGGSLKIDNQKLLVKGPGQVIVVEKEGALIPVNGEIRLYEEGREGIIIKQGGIYQNQIQVFPMNCTVKNDNIEIPDPTQPTTTQPETTQAPVTKPSEEIICLLTTDVISVDSQIAEIRLSVPEVPHDTKEVYIYYSKDKEKWEKVYWLDDTVAGDPKEVKNFVTEMQKVPPYTYIPYEHIFEEYGVQDKIYLKVQIIGPTRSGMSTVADVNLKDHKISGSGTSGVKKNTGGSTYSGGFSGFSGTYGGSGGGSGTGTTESSGAEDGLPVIFLSRTAPYWLDVSRAAESSLAAAGGEGKGLVTSTEETGGTQEETETSPYEESSSLPEEHMQEGDTGEGGVQWGAGDSGLGGPEQDNGQFNAEEEQKNPAIVILLLGAVFLLIIGAVVWSRTKGKKNKK